MANTKVMARRAIDELRTAERSMQEAVDILHSMMREADLRGNNSVANLAEDTASSIVKLQSILKTRIDTTSSIRWNESV